MLSHVNHYIGKPITTNKRMMGLCGVWYQGTHTYLPDEMSNDSNSSDDNRSNTLVHNSYQCTYTGRKQEKATEGGGGGSKEVALASL